MLLERPDAVGGHIDGSDTPYLEVDCELVMGI